METSPSRVCFITGAAGSIGQATVRALSSRGLVVATADRRRLPEADAEMVADECILDLHDEDALADAIARLERLGRLEHVIAIAGGGDRDELTRTDPSTEELEIFARVVSNNLHIAFATIRAVVPLLRASHDDRSITLLGSINAFGGYGAPGYSAAKAGIIGLTNALAGPLGAEGIRINCLALGTVDTENLRELTWARGATLDLPAIAAKSALRRVLTPADVATAIAAIALDIPGLTGTTVVLDNGQMRVR
jgi:NAD(P)-dependent dehydrogenase (short-subunit alcohol dehydrogenase family)